MIDQCSLELTPMLTIDTALLRIKEAIEVISESERIILKEALGRVLAEPIYSSINIPHERNAAMDGYAFSSAGINTKKTFILNKVGVSWAGQPFKGQLLTGQCVRIFTGAVLPAEADSVIMQEHVEVEEQRIHFPVEVDLGQNIREMGEDIKQGSLLVAPLHKLTAIDMGLLASAGIEYVTVKRRVKIAFFSTGDELVGLGQPLASGQIYDSNRYTLSGLLCDASYSVTDMGVIPDNRQLLQDSFLEAAQNHDVIITTGGASVGEADYVKEILSHCGTVDFWKIAIKPGKPLAFGKIGRCYFFGLPGNPVAVIVTFKYIVEPALKQLAGAPIMNRIQLTARCTSSLKKAPGRQEYQRGILSQEMNGEFLVASSGKQGSNILSAISHANCYIVLPIECSGVQVGDKVRVDLIGDTFY